MSKRMSQPPSPAATIATILPRHLEAVGCSVPSHPLGDFEKKPAQAGKATAPEMHKRHHRFPSIFYKMLAPLAALWQVSNCKCQIGEAPASSDAGLEAHHS